MKPLELDNMKRKIKVIGVGGAGTSIINYMIKDNISKVDFYAVNTDVFDLKVAEANKKLLIGENVAKGCSTNGNIELGRAAALESKEEIHKMIEGADIVFIICGMGGGTGSGAAPIIARIAKEQGCLTIGICAKPFQFEGLKRISNADTGLEELRRYVDSFIVIPNQKLLQAVDENTSLLDAINLTNKLISKTIQAITEMMFIPGLINVDFEDIKAIMANKGQAFIGFGAASGENKSGEAVHQAISNSFLEVGFAGATDAIVHITSSNDLSIEDIDAVIKEIRYNASENLNLIYATAINNNLDDKIIVNIIATGYESIEKYLTYETGDTIINKDMFKGINNLDDSTYENAKKKEIYRYSIPYEHILMKSSSSKIDKNDKSKEKKELINRLLKAFHINGEVISYTKGAIYTCYEILLAPGVTVKKIYQIYDDLLNNLKVKSLRIQGYIPGKSTVGIEIANDVADIIKLGDILTDEFINNDMPLSVAMGKNIDGIPVYQNIQDMPHALIAGMSGAGKTILINSIILSLLLKNSPKDLKLILVDPKRIELSIFNNLPHLATPVIADEVIATKALKWSVAEMERRYEVLVRNRVRNIGDYNKKRLDHPDMEHLPFIVIIIDEFSYLVRQCGEEAKEPILHLVQKARACGIHIILSTQFPTIDIISGAIKANITCRIAFRVCSNIDSRIILDESGAETLLGRGDMLIKNNSTPLRVQGTYISLEEVKSICDYICENYASEYLFTHDDLKKAINKANAGGGMNSKDVPSESEDLLYQIALACVQQGVCSINSIQQGFGLGFNRAQRIVQILEERKIVSPKNGTKGREILVDIQQLKDMFGIDEE